MYFLAFKLALGQLRQKPLARAVVIFATASILLMNGLLLILFHSVSDSLVQIHSARYVTAFLEPTLNGAREQQVLSGVRKIALVGGAELISKDAFVELISKTFPSLSGDLSQIDADAVPRYIKVRAKATTTDIAILKSTLEKMHGVESVEVNATRFAGALKALSGLRQIVAVMFAAMSFALLCILINHFKLSTAFMNQLRQTLTLMGSRRTLLVLPFAFEGAFEGLIAGGLAAAGLIVSSETLRAPLVDLAQSLGYSATQFNVMPLALALLLSGIGFGMMSSFWVLLRVRSR